MNKTTLERVDRIITSGKNELAKSGDKAAHDAYVNMHMMFIILEKLDEIQETLDEALAPDDEGDDGEELEETQFAQQ